MMSRAASDFQSRNVAMPPVEFHDAVSHGTALRRMISDISAEVVAGRSPNLIDIAEILQPAILDARLLDGIEHSGSPDTYTRYKLHSAPGLCIVAIVWRPNQMSPMHSHRSWCVLGVHQGELTELCLTATETPQPCTAEPQVTCRQLRPGMVSYSGADARLFHRIANLGVRPAISIHAYGVAYDRMGQDLNRVWTE